MILKTDTLLTSSFERLLEGLEMAEKGLNDTSVDNMALRYAASYGVLKAYVKFHLTENTDTTFEPLKDDLKELNAFDVVEGEIEDDRRRAAK